MATARCCSVASVVVLLSIAPQGYSEQCVGSSTLADRGRPHHDGRTGAASGGFETWVLAFEWQPSWSLPDCKDGKGPLVRSHLTEGSFADANLSLHGLWPNYDEDKHDGYKWPQFCTGPQGDFTSCAEHGTVSDKCNPPKEAIAMYNTTELWQRFALEYAFSCLSLHEWSKHGGCTGWPADKYFHIEQVTYQKIIETKGPQFIASNVDKNVSTKELIEAFDNAATFMCSDSCDLTDVMVQLKLDTTTLEPTTLDTLSTETKWGCEACDQVSIPSWKGCPPPLNGQAAGMSPEGELFV